MAENDPRETPSQVKGKSTSSNKKPQRRTIDVDLDGPLFEPNRWYRAEYMWKKRLRCGKHTWLRYVAAGLKVYHPGTRHGFVWSSDLDKYIKMSDSELPPIPKRSKPAARKKKES